MAHVLPPIAAVRPCSIKRTRALDAQGRLQSWACQRTVRDLRAEALAFRGITIQLI